MQAARVGVSSIKKKKAHNSVKNEQKQKNFLMVPKTGFGVGSEKFQNLGRKGRPEMSIFLEIIKRSGENENNLQHSPIIFPKSRV